MRLLDLSNVQRMNLSMLLMIRDDIKEDLVSACCKYGLYAEQAAWFQDRSIDDVLAIVANVGQECLFPPRQDLFALLKAPLPLAGPLASVHPPKNVASPPPLKKAT
jgi:hypothetical protein